MIIFLAVKILNLLNIKCCKMKCLCFVFLFWVPFLVSSQSVDSLAIKEIDSLILVSRDLTNKNDFEKAIEINKIA